MNFDLQKAVEMLASLLLMSKTTTDAVAQEDLDSVVSELLPAALKDVERLANDWVKEREAHEERLLAAEDQARLDVIEEEQRAAKALIQDAVDQEQRQERSIAGVS